MSGDEFSFIVRVACALVWSGVLIRLMRSNLPVTEVRRVVVIGTFVAVLWGVAVRGATIIGLVDYELSLVIVSAVTFAALVVGISLLTLRSGE